MLKMIFIRKTKIFFGSIAMKVFNNVGAVPFVVGETRSKEEIEESAVWQKLTETKIIQFNASINRIKFSPLDPNPLVVLSGLTGPWINGKSYTQDFAFAKAKAQFSAVAFRNDGVLIALGREDGTVDIYPTKDHQTLLRRFKLHSGIIHDLAFSPFSNTVVAACGDGTIQIMDVSGANDVVVIKAHNDAVSSIIPMESGNIWVSGSHDKTVGIWDLNKQEKIGSIETENPVSNLVAKGRRVFAASSENVVAIDILAKITKVGTFTLHNRPIVGLTIVRSNLVTASSDRQIKIIDPASFTVLYTIKMHSDIVIFAALPDATKFACALSGGVLQIRHLPEKSQNKTERPQVQMPANFRVFRPPQNQRKEKWNQCLIRFEFAEALDYALKESDPAIGIGMIDELDRLGGLDAAIAGRDAMGVQPLLKFLIANVSNPTWSSVVLKAVIVFERIYRRVIGDVPAVGKMFDELSSKIGEELKEQRRAAMLIGKIDLLLK